MCSHKQPCESLSQIVGPSFFIMNSGDERTIILITNSSDKWPRLPTDFINSWCSWDKSTRICPKFGQHIQVSVEHLECYSPTIRQVVSMTMVFHWLYAPNACIIVLSPNILSNSRSSRFSPDPPRCNSFQIWDIRDFLIWDVKVSRSKM